MSGKTAFLFFHTVIHLFRLRLQKTVLYVCIACFLLFFSFSARAQIKVNGKSEKPAGKFLADSVEVGKPVFYALTFRHKPESEVFFPDSTFDFSPFEILSKKNFSSSTDRRGTFDSTLYQLVTFEVFATQLLRAPIYIFNGRDCTAIYPETDTVFLKKDNLKVLEDMETLKAETDLLPLGREFNFSFVLGVAAVAIALIGSIYWVFGREIQKQWKLIKLQRRHIEYIRSFNKLLRNAREKSNIKDAEKAIIVWKNYLERLEKKPFATYTTREIMDNMPDDVLAEALKNMDGIIYGQVKSKTMDSSLEVLKAGATKLYRTKRRQILDSNLQATD